MSDRALEQIARRQARRRRFNERLASLDPQAEVARFQLGGEPGDAPLERGPLQSERQIRQAELEQLLVGELRPIRGRT